MEYQLDELGFLPNPWLHDGMLTGITVMGDVVKLGLSTVEQQQVSLTLHDTVAFIGTDFRLGNIVSEIRVSVGTEVNRERLADLYPPPDQSVDRHFHEAYDREVDEKRKAILDGELTLVELTSSYGCEIVALCRRVSCFAEQTS